MTRSASGSAWATLLPYALLLGTAFSVFVETVDDPYITFRYAANLLAGHGPVFNIHERVEGFSSPLHLLLSALLLRVAPGVDILFKAKLASLAFGLLMVFQTGRLARAAGLRRPEALLAQCLLALSVNFALASVNALETTLYGCLLMACALRFLAECRRRSGDVSALLLACALLARPDALLMFAALLVVRLWWRGKRQLPWAFVLRWLALFLVPAAALLGLRWGYFGQPLPNTYYAKQQLLGVSLANGLVYLERGLWRYSLDPALFRQGGLKGKALFTLYVLFALLFWGTALRGALRARRRLAGVVLLALTAGALLFVLRSGGDWMPGWRFVAPVLPLLAALQVWGLRALPGRPGRRRYVTPGSWYALAALWLVAALLVPHRPWTRAHFSTRGPDLLRASGALGPRWVAAGDYIRDRLPPRASVAYSELGYAGYVNMDKSFLDTRGLTDRQVARMPVPARDRRYVGIVDPDWEQPTDPLYRIIARRRPDYILSPDGPPRDHVLRDYRRIDAVGTVNDSEGRFVPFQVYQHEKGRPRH